MRATIRSRSESPAAYAYRESLAPPPGYCPGGGAWADYEDGRARKVRCSACGRRLTGRTITECCGGPTHVLGHKVPRHKPKGRQAKARRQERRGMVR